MMVINDSVSKPVKSLLEAINAFAIDLIAADEKRDTERVAAFVGLVSKHEMFDNEEAITFAMLPLDKPLDLGD